MHSDVLIIGAGPAGISTAVKLEQLGFQGTTRIIEVGAHQQKRPCPVDKHHEKGCQGCGGVCRVISGFGGCIHYGDGVKLSGFPAGRRLMEKLGEGAASEYIVDVMDTLFSDEAPSFVQPDPKQTSLPLKSYPVLPLKPEQVMAVIDELSKLIDNSSKVQLELKTEVIAIEPSATGFIVHVRQKKEVKRYTCDKLVVATGRAGLWWWRKQLRELSVEHTEPVISIGLRFETKNRYLAGPAENHPDFKTSLFHSNEHGVRHKDQGGMNKFKSFCFCADKETAGQIKFMDWGHVTLLDGHVMAKPHMVGTDPGDAPANFALLAQLRAPDGTPRSFRWLERELLPQYRALRPNKPGKPVAQWYPDFRDQRVTIRDLDTLKKKGVPLSLLDYEMGNIASLFGHLHEGFCDVFEHMFSNFAGANAPLEEVAVIGLELEGMWDTVEVDDNMQTSTPGLYAVGDCAGVAQGILQSMVSGCAAAKGIVS